MLSFTSRNEKIFFTDNIHIMKSNFLKSALFIGSLVSFAACNNLNNEQKDTKEAPMLTVTPFETGSPEFPDAQLSIKSMTSKLNDTKDSAIITIDYDVVNYALKLQTSDATGKGCDNSKDGQHIHFILNNNPYIALYEPTRTFSVPVNTEHYVMSFLSRSYHESVKSPGASVLKHFKVDEKGVINDLEIPNNPMIFFSRPKGDYVGEGKIENVLLDFYLYNTNLDDGGFKVKAKINDLEMTIDEWQPYFIKNAPEGKLVVSLNIVNDQGHNVSGENTSVTQSANIAKQEPIQ